MARSVTLGNGNILVGLDYRGQVRDFYHPYVGHSNHISGASGSYAHRIGVWVDGALRWLSDESWHIDARCGAGTASSSITAQNDYLRISLHIEDIVHNEKNVFIRKITVTNEQVNPRIIKLFFGQEFRISESRRGDTAFFDPRVNAVVHYKGHNAFLINAFHGDEQFSEYSVGIFGIEGKEGTFADAEDGELSKNPIEHGSVDSVIGLSLSLNGRETTEVYYWVAVGDSILKAHELNAYIREETPGALMESTKEYWHAWMGKESRDLSQLPEELQELYRRSLSVIRIHADNRGGIIASSDSDMLNQGRDNYSYVWPRDAAISANALDRTGYVDTTQRFFEFMAKCVEPDGYLMHKYRVDAVLGSSWHPWVRDGQTELPIQEDETALVLFMLWKHYVNAKDLEFIESLYNTFIEPAANFMCEYIEESTGLPKSTYDLWEEKYGTSTYTAAAVFGALQACADFAALLGKREDARKYRARSERVREGILGYLYDPDMGMFVKHVRHKGETLEYDRTIDISSFHGILFFGILEADDKRVVRSKQVVEERLAVQTECGGYMRYEGDQYYKTNETAPPNAWCITTLWMAQYYIRAAQRREDLDPALDILTWVNRRASESNILPEQIHPYTGGHLSTAPLVWSHAEYVITVDEYLKKLQTF